ncbi:MULTISPECIES: nuclear transport factor 2 family protein [unclassified Pseudofrankia]|uniref:nuclear transport factor 2 family protein n=1 Tax=unclassified Pseudofrankia TaxID=2994372 RepID=UPI0009F6B8D4|nr:MULTISPECIES: nuclear transport factor 2 family protein [unclassified Pseudofrankia]MDT3440268.1 nuclear transport factor 2 family protein [Pseudofrankia sp. BMG5.37]
MDIHTLGEIEQIKQLKARYLRLADEKKWDEWADVFTDDFCGWLGDVPEEEFNSRDEFIAFIRRAIGAAVTVHHGHMPEIEVVGPGKARGIWAMYDYVKFVSPEGDLELDGYGHYHEEYRKCDDGQWRISSLRLTRVLGMVEQLQRKLPGPVIPATRDAASRQEGLVRS